MLAASLASMGMKKGNVAQRAWKLLRVAWLWTRKGGVFRRRLVVELRLLPKYLKQLSHTSPPPQIYYCERQFSFDNTPLFHLNMSRPSSLRFHLPRIPCINPPLDFDYDFDVPDLHSDHQIEYGYEGTQDMELGTAQQQEEDEEGIDRRAEEFIAKFYEQMKLQRQISYLQYHDTPHTHTS